MNPQDVLYSQSTISQVFDGGEPLADVAAAIKAGRMQASTLPPIRVLLHGGTYYSLDNRRLWVLRHSGVTSITVIKVALALTAYRRAVTAQQLRLLAL